MKKKYALPVLIGFTVFGIAFVSSYLRTGAAPPGLSNTLEVELITLRPAGFEPAEIIRPKGPFVLVVDDRSGKQNSSFRLQRINGEQLREVNTTRMKSEWHDVVNLPPGDYLLTNTDSASGCQIRVLP
jgi:hypothetical protein